MKPRTTLLLLFFTVLTGCGYLRGLFSRQDSPREDTSVVFPRFFDRPPIKVGTENTTYELDGEMLRALSIAAADYLPSEDKDLPCPSRREAQLYRVIRQGDILFVYVHENFRHCGRQYPVRHSGAKYAITRDGRILRRLIGEQSESPLDLRTPDDGGRWEQAEPGVSAEFDEADSSHTPERTDGGTAQPLDAGNVGTNGG